MASKYAKLDQFLDEAFKGSPNTLEASEIKIEIITNLRQMYDELLESGLSEDEALSKTCDSLGNPAEIFGESGAEGVGSAENAGNVGNSGENGYFGPNPGRSESPGGPGGPADSGNPSQPRRAGRRKPPATPFRSVVIMLGVLLCALCWFPTVILAVNGASGGWIASPILAMVAVGVFCFIYAGSMRVGTSAKHRLHYFFIGLGVACLIGCAAPLLLLLDDIGLGVSLLLTLVAAGIMLIILGAVIPTDRWLKGEKAAEDPPKSPLERAIWLAITALYLLLSFSTGAWEVTWILFLIGSAVITLVRGISDLK